MARLYNLLLDTIRHTLSPTDFQIPFTNTSPNIAIYTLYYTVLLKYKNLFFVTPHQKHGFTHYLFTRS